MTRILTILSFVLLSAFGVKAQQSRDPFQESAQRIMKLYPNPAVSFIKFDFQQKYSSGYSLQIINFIGRQVYEMKNINPSSTLDLTPYNRGVYIYQLKDQYGKLVESGKFQVSK